VEPRGRRSGPAGATFALVLRLVAALAAGLALACAAERPPRPNFVVLLADDLGFGDLGFHGAPDLRTPELDRLAREGASFTDAYAASPVCSPTRVALLTGLYPQRLGHDFEDFQNPGAPGLDPARYTTLAELLRRAGYRTACYGKWNVEGNERRSSLFLPNAHGFEHWFGTRRNHDYHTHRSLWSGKPDLYEDGKPVEVEGYTDRLLADHAVQLIENAAVSGKPFLLYVPWLLPHYPLQTPDDPAIAPLGHRATYVKMVEFLDLQVGRILQALRDAGIDQDTLVVFTSDNGGHTTARNAPLRGGKQDLTEGGIRVPLILRWPGVIPAGRRVGAPAVTMDLTVSILTAAGLPDAARRMDGVDLLPIVTGRSSARPRTLFWRRRDIHVRKGIDRVLARAVREGEWKLLESDGAVSLYHLPDDPGEERDLAAREPARLARLAAFLEAWERDVAPPGDPR
jgi:arylsulfatase A-like enzyme